VSDDGLRQAEQRFGATTEGGGWFAQSAALRGLTERFAAERYRWANWTPVLMGAGIVAYFTLPAEPALWTGPVILAAILALLLLMRRSPAGVVLALALLAVGVGYMAAVTRSHLVAAPRLAAELRPRAVEGEVVDVESFPKYYRMLLSSPSVAELAPEETPHRLRITVRTGGAVPIPGDHVTLRAGLFPPAGPAAPGAYDFGEAAWFARLGALGYAVSRPEIAPPASRSLAARIAMWRQSITRRIIAGSPGETGPVAAAIITGDESGIEDGVREAFRISGIAHLLAISGLNLGLATGIIFYALRGGLALVPQIALRYPIKKWAAGAALLAGAAYTVLAGMPIPAVRSFLMTALVLMAVMLDRTAISMRLVVIAAVVLLLATPEALFNISFQMSFAAVVALIAFYEVLAARGGGAPHTSIMPRWLFHVLELCATSLVAGFATDIFGAYEFHRIAIYGMVTNLVAIPLTGVWVMPWAVVTMILMPFGLESWGLTPMGWGLEVIIWAARWVAAWPGAVWLIPAFGSAALILMVLGGLWLALWRRRWRVWGVAPLLAGLLLAALAPRADILLNGDGSLIALRQPDGLLAFNTGRGGRIARDTWLERNAQAKAERWPQAVDQEDWLTCDDWGCVYRREGVTVSILTARQGADEDCRLADLVIADFPLPRDCRPRLGSIDRFDIWRSGPHTVRLDGGKAHIDTVAAHQGSRPWSRQPGQ
jgi:competence protein ComEC